MNPRNGTVASAAGSGVPRFPYAEEPAAAGSEEECRSAASAARVAAAVAAANAEMSDRFEARVFVDRVAAGDNDRAIGRNDVPVPAADMAAAHRTLVVVATVAAMGYSAATAMDNSAAVQPGSSVAARVDCSVAAEVRSGVAREAGLIFVGLAAFGDAVGPGGKDAAVRYGGFAQDTAPPRRPAS